MAVPFVSRAGLSAWLDSSGDQPGRGRAWRAAPAPWPGGGGGGGGAGGGGGGVGGGWGGGGGGRGGPPRGGGGGGGGGQPTVLAAAMMAWVTARGWVIRDRCPELISV